MFAGPQELGYDGGVIEGTMTIKRGATEENTHAVGKVDLAATDPVMGTWGRAKGTQVTNNVTDVPVGGRIVVTISGNLTVEDFTAMTPPVVSPGTITCSIHLPYAIGPGSGQGGPGQPPDSESVIADADAD